MSKEFASLLMLAIILIIIGLLWLIWWYITATEPTCPAGYVSHWSQGWICTIAPLKP